MLPHLAKCAKERRTITYQELGELIGKPPYYLGQTLDILRDRIFAEHHLPRLDALVVNKESREAGSSFYAGGRDNLSDEQYRDLLDYERKKVFDYAKWDEVVLKLQERYGGIDYLKARKLQRHDG